MRPHIVTTGIILRRLNYGESDRILTVISPDHGKLRLMAKGVRKSVSKLAGGIELFSISSITYIPGRREINTLISTRLVTHYSHIVADLGRTTIGYEFLKLIDKSTQDECGPEFYQKLVVALSNLNQLDMPVVLIEVWFYTQLLGALGHSPNTRSASGGQKLAAGEKYLFDFETMSFKQSPSGRYNDKHIKLLRLLQIQEPEKLLVIGDAGTIATELQPLLKTAIQHSIN